MRESVGAECLEECPTILKKVVPRDFMGTLMSVLPCLDVLVPPLKAS